MRSGEFYIDTWNDWPVEVITTDRRESDKSRVYVREYKPNGEQFCYWHPLKDFDDGTRFQYSHAWDNEKPEASP